MWWPFGKKGQKTPEPSLPRRATASAARPTEEKIDLRDRRYQGAGHHRVADGLLHLEWARQARQAGDHDRARAGYLKCVESWKQANQAEGGKWERELDLAKKEYEGFVQMDPAYRQGLLKLLPLIRANPGVLQSDLYAQCPDLDRERISYILYFADAMGQLRRVKKGRSYELFADDAAS